MSLVGAAAMAGLVQPMPLAMPHSHQPPGTHVLHVQEKFVQPPPLDRLHSTHTVRGAQGLKVTELNQETGLHYVSVCLFEV